MPKKAVASTETSPAAPVVMWRTYKVSVQITGKFAASLPKTRKEIEAMLTNRMPTNPPKDFTPLPELIDKVVAEVGADAPPAETPQESEMQFGWATFPKDTAGNLIYEGRCIRGHIKDCATQIKDFFPDVAALKSKVANKVHVVEDVIQLNRDNIDGTEERFIQVMTRMGPRSTIKYIDYLNSPKFSFTLKVLNDKVITLNIIKTIFDYGSMHGLGQERSQGWGRYTFTIEEA